MGIYNEKILVTGGAGYIGSVIVHFLNDKGFNVHVIDNLTTGSEKFLPENVNFYNLDISLGNKVTRVLKQVSPKVVIHLAASVEVEESIINPIKYYENNISNSISFLKSCIEAKIENIIFSSTAAVYGSSKLQNKIKENFRKTPKSPYGYSKLIMENILLNASKNITLRV